MKSSAGGAFAGAGFFSYEDQAGICLSVAFPSRHRVNSKVTTSILSRAWVTHKINISIVSRPLINSKVTVSIVWQAGER